MWHARREGPRKTRTTDANLDCTLFPMILDPEKANRMKLDWCGDLPASISNEVDEAAGEISRVVSDLANIAETTDHDQKDEDGDENGEKMVEGQETQT